MDGSDDSGQWVALAVTLKTALSCLAYSMILADSVQSLAVAAPGLHDVTRTQALGAVTGIALLPLCLMRDLSSLAPFSILGLIGMAITAAAMVLRCVDGSYGVGGEFYVPPPPAAAGIVGGGHIPDLNGVALLACTLFTGFIAHYNSPRFYNELRDNTMTRFGTVVAASFGVSALVFIVVAASGFLTFGTNSQGLILNNYSPYDPIVAVSRAAIALSLVFTYPLPFVGFRDGVLDTLRVPQERRSGSFLTGISIGLLAFVTVGAWLIHDLSLVLSVGGGTFSTAVTAVFPALMYKAIAENDAKLAPSVDGKEGSGLSGANATLVITEVLMWLCVGIGGYGVFLALQKASI